MAPPEKAFFKTLQPKTREAIRLHREMRRKRNTPSFRYQNLPDTDRLRYELVTWKNFTAYLDLFQNDPNPFVDEHFKTRPKLERYIAHLLEYSRYSFKHGGCDWLLRLKIDGTPIGVLHVYDLNWEFIDGKFFPCMVGYALGEAFRKQGFAYEAASHLLNQIPVLFQRYEAMAEPLAGNHASNSVLRKLGFTQKRSLSDRHSTIWHKKLVRRIPLTNHDEYLRERETLEDWWKNHPPADSGYPQSNAS